MIITFLFKKASKTKKIHLACEFGEILSISVKMVKGGTLGESARVDEMQLGTGARAAQSPPGERCCRNVVPLILSTRAFV